MHIAASAPTRIDLAGGTIDIWPLYLFHDGAATHQRGDQPARARRGRRACRTTASSCSRSTRRAEISARHWSELEPGGQLPLLARVARHYRLERASVTTQAESPAGAGIAGSSALTIALCGALARFAGASMNPDDLLQVAMNIECQTIRVPTGVQDYRPAMYGGIAAIELRRGRRQAGRARCRPPRARTAHRPGYTRESRGIPGTNNWEITKRHIDGDRDIFDCFERIRDTAAAMRAALERGDWDEVGRQIAIEWDNRKRLAPGVTTPTIEDLIARASAAGATAAKVCGAGGGGCLFCYGPPSARPAIAEALADGRSAGARLSHRDGRPPAWITWPSRAFSGRLPICWRSRTTTPSRSARIATAPTSPRIIRTSSPRSTKRACARSRASGRIWLPESARSPKPAARPFIASSWPSFRRPSWICSTCRASGPRPSPRCTASSASGRSTISSARRPMDASARCAAWARKRKALILKALEERKRHAGRHLLPDAHDAAAALVDYLRERAPQATITPVGSLRRGCDTCGDLDLLASGADRSLMDDFVGYRAGRTRPRARRHEVERAPPGGFQADLRLVPPRKPRRGPAVLHRIEGTQHRACGIVRSASG